MIAAESDDEAKKKKIVLLEASDALGGRLKSDVTEDGFVLDRGFAVFIDEFPAAKKILDYDGLKLGRFLPGARIKLADRSELALVADPLRRPEDLLEGLFAPIGSFADKLRFLPLIFHLRERSVDELFEEEEIDTLVALTVRWGFSDVIIDRFFKPFLEGIYLAPLVEQSSRMFSFVLKMFSEGYASLPEGGIGAVAAQLAEKATVAGVDVRVGTAVTKISTDKDNSRGFLVETDDKTFIKAEAVVVATDGPAATTLLSNLDGFESLDGLPQQPQRSVGCLYYAFDGPPPISEPILILNGIGEERGNAKNPVNNACFPSVVNKGYAPEGKGLCSVTVLKNAMDTYKGREDKLDAAVRKQLSEWFPTAKDSIRNPNDWKLKRIYNIPNAQPSQLYGPWPANKVRKVTAFRGFTLPKGLVVCGDHMATASYDGALESGLLAGAEAARAIQ